MDEDEVKLLAVADPTRQVQLHVQHYVSLQ